MKPEQALLEAVARDIPKNSWRWVFRELMKNSPRAEIAIQNIESNYEKDLGEQKFQALKTWLNSVGDKATIGDLDKALRNHDCSIVADKHTGPVLSSKPSQDGVGKYLCYLLPHNGYFDIYELIKLFILFTNCVMAKDDVWTACKQ